ncbi:MAG: sodium:solute symporter family protein [Spirochaetales bacterium]|nr:sodium:solute symporter family protein [Spirochaetales bacterium]
MGLAAIAILLFLAANLAFALFTRVPSDHVSFALESRSISGFRLACTMLASNLSAFTIFGVSGASYRIGWAYFPVMAFGTAFMALSFPLFGIPLRRLAARHGWISPGDAIRDRFASPAAGALFSMLLLIYTLPYIATQAGTAGSLLSSSLGLHPWIGSAIVMAVVLLYILRGGMRSVTNSDILQLLVMLALGCTAALIVLSAAAALPASAATEAFQQALSREGRGGSSSALELVGYYLLWFFADPMFPHLTQRFFAARDDRSILQVMAAYPFVSLAIFFAMTSVGVAGILMEPGLTGRQTDGIFTILMARYGGLAGPVFSLAALAALMSTLDSQILSSTSLLIELFKGSTEKKSLNANHAAHPRAQLSFAAWYRLGASALVLVGWLVSLRPPATILSFLTSTSFLGYASLAPVMLAALYAPHVGSKSAIAAMLAGSGLVLALGLGIIRLPVPTILLILAVTGSILAAGAVLRRGRMAYLPRVDSCAVNPRYWLVLGTFFFLGTDIWNFGKPVTRFLGIPVWVWYHSVAILAMGLFLATQGPALLPERCTQTCEAGKEHP